MNIALLYHRERKVAETVFDHIRSFSEYSSHNIVYIPTDSEKLTRKNLEKFDVLVIHYNIFMISDYRLPPYLRVLIRNLGIKKVVFIQDEYREINRVIESLNYLGIDLLFTCFPTEEIEKVYPAKKLPKLSKVMTLTGFVPQKLLKRSLVPYEERFLDVCYRARKVPLWLGSLGQEKWRIAGKFKEDAEQFSLKYDISYEEKDRIYGKKWVNFLSYSKAVLGCESGYSVCDFTGEIQRKVEEYEVFQPYASAEKVEKIFFPELDGKIYMNQISPRCFESAALGTLMILYEGKYSGILTPWRHYVPLKKDHSNMREVVSFIQDKEKWEQITKAAYEEVACNPLYSYKNFIEQFDRIINTHFSHLIWKKPLQIERINFSGMIGSRLGIKSFSPQVIFVSFCRIVIERTPIISKYRDFFRDFYRKINILILLWDIIYLKKINLKSIWLLSIKKNILREIILILQIFSYAKKIKNISENKALCLYLDKKNKMANIFLGSEEELCGERICSMSDLKDIKFPIRVTSSNSLGIPEELRDMDIPLKHWKEILELIK